MNSDNSSSSGAAGQASTPVSLRRVVHDLRNVVAPLSNASQLLRLRSKADAQLAPIADILDRQVAYMVRMLNELAGMTAGEAAASTPLSASTASAAAGPRRILIVDDNEALLTSLSSVLRETGHSVKTTHDSREVLAIAREWKPQFILLDAAMPHLNGYEVARQLRAAFSREAIKLVLMSGSTLDETTRRGAELAGFDRCIDKIHGIEALEALLKSA